MANFLALGIFSQLLTGQCILDTSFLLLLLCYILVSLARCSTQVFQLSIIPRDFVPLIPGNYLTLRPPEQFDKLIHPSLKESPGELAWEAGRILTLTTDRLSFYHKSSYFHEWHL